MSGRRSTAPAQIDPIRARLRKAAPPRDVTCPSCGVVFATERRWQLHCPECHHAWTDRSSRTAIDSLRDALPELGFRVFLVASVLLAAGGFLTFVVWLFAAVADERGWDRTYGIAALFVASFISLLVMARVMRH